jgi:hypothetical protein
MQILWQHWLMFLIVAALFMYVGRHTTFGAGVIPVIG